MLIDDLLYHLTPTRNLPAILRQGLLPRIGPRSAALGELIEAVYLFVSLDDLDNALDNWLGEELEDEEALTMLEVRLPASLRRALVAYEVQVFDPIPASSLRVVSKAYGE